MRLTPAGIPGPARGLKLGYSREIQTMADKKIIAVVGATGAQGGGLVRAILADPASGFTARAITRDVNSDKAKALAGARRRGRGGRTSTTPRA